MDKMNIDVPSFELGMINCFVEMVECGVKKLALSPPIEPENYEKIKELSDALVEGFSIYSYLDKSLIITDIQSEEFTRGKWSILYYSDPAVLDEYLALKERKHRLESSGEYSEEQRKSLSMDFGRMLSYPEEVILKKINKSEPATPFTLI